MSSASVPEQTDEEGAGFGRGGGLLVSQLLTHYITPVVYYYMDRIRSWFMLRFKKPQYSGVQADKENMCE